MKLKLILMSLPLAIFLIGCAFSGSRAARGSAAPPQAKDLAHHMVQVAADRYREGQLESAKTILEASLEVDPGSAEARYYLGLVRNSQYHDALQVWYPTIPPQPASQ